MVRASVIVGMMCTFALAGCAPAGSTSAVQVASPPVASTAIPTGTVLRVRLEATLSTETGRIAQEFTARVMSPISAWDRVILPAGAIVHGRATRVEEGTPGLRLEFSSITTPRGEVPIDATIARLPESQRFHLGVLRTPDGRGTETVVMPEDRDVFERSGGLPSYPGFGYYERSAHEVRLPVNTELDLVLERALVIPE